MSETKRTAFRFPDYVLAKLDQDRGSQDRTAYLCDLIAAGPLVGGGIEPMFPPRRKLDFVEPPLPPEVAVVDRRERRITGPPPGQKSISQRDAERRAAKETDERDCPHPVNRLIGGHCTLCGKKVR